MRKDNTKYTEKSIISEDPKSFLRRTPGMTVGSVKTNTNLFKEVFTNAIDEYAIGHCKKITINIDTKKNIYIVEDDGQGFLINAGIDEKGKTILQRAFDTMNTSGKTSADGVYMGVSCGLHGIGAKATNYLSLSLDVITWRDNQYEHIWFKDGDFQNREIGATDHLHGTRVTWSPDPQFFKSNIPDIVFLKEYFEEISALCPELTIDFTYNGEQTIYFTPGGLNSLMDKRVKGKELFTNRFIQSRKVGNDKLDICITYTSDYSENLTAYVNLGKTESGAHISSMKTAFVKALNKLAIEAGLLKKKDKNFTSGEISEGLQILFNLTTTSAKYDAQNKTRIDDIDSTAITTVMGGDFAAWLMNNPTESNIIVERAITARKAKEAAKSAKEKIRNVSKKSKNVFLDMPTKLTDAYPKNRKDRSNCELYIVEGQSASSSITAVRDASFQAVYPIRGKILNCCDAEMQKVYANQEINNIVKALGLEIQKDGKLIYDKKKLRYNKIILACDEDADSHQIRALLMTVLDWLCPELIKNGHVYRTQSALYKVIFNDKSYKLFDTDDDFNNWRLKNKRSYSLERNKGLGSLTKEDSLEQLVDPKTRGLLNITAKDYEEFLYYLDIFQGSNVESRRNYLSEHYNDYDEV